MAGGMRRSQGVGSLADRVGASSGDPPPAPAALKHCWVVDDHGRLPALLLEWRRTASGFQGRVVRPVREADGWVVVEEWLPASVLEPATTGPARDADGGQPRAAARTEAAVRDETPSRE